MKQRRETGIEQRFYRKSMEQSRRFRSFTVGYKDTDLWIGVDPGSYCEEMIPVCEKKIVGLRKELESYLLTDPSFAGSLVPYKPKESAPEIAHEMAGSSERAGIGPLGAVAGAFAERVGRELIQVFDVKEVVVENGGDLFIKLKKALPVAVYAGNSPLSGKVGLEIPASVKELGVCTSAGTVGPSLSLGKADAVMVACRKTSTADAWATSLGNRVKSAADIQPVLEYARQFEEILSVVIICEGQLGICGNFELKINA